MCPGYRSSNTYAAQCLSNTQHRQCRRRSRRSPECGNAHCAPPARSRGWPVRRFRCRSSRCAAPSPRGRVCRRVRRPTGSFGVRRRRPRRAAAPGRPLRAARSRTRTVRYGSPELGRGTTVIDTEDGSLADYLESLHRLRGLGQRTVLPGHGPDLPNLEAVASGYLAHREQRLEQVRSALRDLGDDATTRQVVEHVYVDVDEELWDVAEWSVQAQLDYLRR